MESPRYFVYGPPVNNIDLSVSKSFPLGGRRRVEVRLDAFNALNTVQFSSVNSTANFNSERRQHGHHQPAVRLEWQPDQSQRVRDRERRPTAASDAADGEVQLLGGIRDQGSGFRAGASPRGCRPFVCSGRAARADVWIDHEHATRDSANPRRAARRVDRTGRRAAASALAERARLLRGTRRERTRLQQLVQRRLQRLQTERGRTDPPRRPHGHQRRRPAVQHARAVGSHPPALGPPDRPGHAPRAGRALLPGPRLPLPD